AYEYQSVMVLVAGRAVEAASGKPWQEFVQKRIFDPLGMTGAGFTTAAARAAADHASPHRQGRGGKVAVIPWYEMAVPNPAGRVNASARDLAKWVQLHLGEGSFRGKRLVSAAALAETHTPQTIMRLDEEGRATHPHTHRMDYGMGWVIQDYRGHLLV